MAADPPNDIIIIMRNIMFSLAILLNRLTFNGFWQQKLGKNFIPMTIIVDAAKFFLRNEPRFLQLL